MFLFLSVGSFETHRKGAPLMHLLATIRESERKRGVGGELARERERERERER